MLDSWAATRLTNSPDDFIKVSSGRGRVGNGQSNDFLRVNHEYGADLAVD